MLHVWSPIKQFFLLMALVACVANATPLNFKPLKYGEYAEQIVNSVTYGVYHAPIAQVSLHWRDANGKAYGSLHALKNALEQLGQEPFFLMNAGIYTNNYHPAGLWIEQGHTLSSLNTNHGEGNFHIQPNGVFLINHQRAQILTTKAYATITEQPEYAVQSGPMLLIDGQINSRFIKGIDSPYKRNAVCTTADGQLYFIMTIAHQSQWPNFYDFSQGLQSFGCQQALYLDGSISAWYIQGITKSFHWRTFVGIIAVTSK